MEGITIGESPIGLKIKKNPLKITIGGNGGAPAPPTPSGDFPYITSDFMRIEQNQLVGDVVSDWSFTPEEE